MEKSKENLGILTSMPIGDSPVVVQRNGVIRIRKRKNLSSSKKKRVIVFNFKYMSKQEKDADGNVKEQKPWVRVLIRTAVKILASLFGKKPKPGNKAIE